MTDKPKLLILGYGRHGKDTVAEFLRDDYGFKFTSSSLFVAQEVMWDSWGVAKYPTFEAMFEDRSNHRVLWMEMISAYNTPDKTKTATTMLERGFDLYVGMRRLDELQACQAAGIFDAIIWVDASDRHPPETGSMDITLANSGAEFVIDNNGPEDAIVDEIVRMMDWLKERGIEVVAENIFKDDMPPHPWDSMSPVEILADWLGADVDELAEITDPVPYPIPVRASPDMETLGKALTSLECVMWYDAFERKMVVASTSEDFIDVFEDDDPWAPALEAMATAEDTVPVFKSTRSKVGQLETVETSVQGATTIINIENIYVTDKD